jgi:hypothetical protein
MLVDDIIKPILKYKETILIEENYFLQYHIEISFEAKS